jgi:hypothetical protein
MPHGKGLKWNTFFNVQVYDPWRNVANAAFGFPQGSRFLKFTIDALFKSFEIQPRKAKESPYS